MTSRKPALGFIFVPALADVLGYGLMLPVLPRILSGLVEGGMDTAAAWGGWLAGAYALVQIFFAPLLGSLGDRYGRRIVLLLSLFPLAIDSAMLAFAPSIAWLFAGKILGGVIGGSYSVASAYTADITPPAGRSRNFAILNSSFGIGMILGPVLGGTMASHGLYLPCYAALGLSAANILYTFFIVPESLDATRRSPLVWKRAHPLDAIARLWGDRVVWGLLVAMGLFYIANDVMDSVWSYFAIEKFAWTEERIGWSLGAMGLGFAIVQGLVCPWLLPRIGERRAIYAGLLLQCVTFACIAFVPAGWMLFALMLPMAAGTIFGPAIQSMTSIRTPDDRQGELQGGLSALRNITSIIGPPMMTGIFSLFAAQTARLYFPGMPFAVSALLMLAAVAVVRNTLRHK